MNVVVELTAAEQVAQEMAEQQAFERHGRVEQPRGQPDGSGFDHCDIPERVKSMIRWPLLPTTTYGDIVDLPESLMKGESNTALLDKFAAKASAS